MVADGRRIVEPSLSQEEARAIFAENPICPCCSDKAGMPQHHALMQNEVAALMQNEVAAVLDGVVKVGQNMPHRFSCASVND